MNHESKMGSDVSHAFSKGIIGSTSETGLWLQGARSQTYWQSKGDIFSKLLSKHQLGNLGVVNFSWSRSDHASLLRPARGPK